MTVRKPESGVTVKLMPPPWGACRKPGDTVPFGPPLAVTLPGADIMAENESAGVLVGELGALGDGRWSETPGGYADFEREYLRVRAQAEAFEIANGAGDREDENLHQPVGDEQGTAGNAKQRGGIVGIGGHGRGPIGAALKRRVSMPRI